MLRTRVAPKKKNLVKIQHSFDDNEKAAGKLVRALVRGVARVAMATPLFENLLSKGGQFRKNCNFLLMVATPVLKSYRGPWVIQILGRQN